MGRKMTPLQALKKIKQARYFVDFELDAKVGEDYKKELKIIETELKEKEQQDNVLKVLKEVIEFAVVLPEVKPTKDDIFSVVSAVSINTQRFIENKERELFRQWVLETCFPKELKRLETLEEDFMSLTETNMELVQEQARNQKKLKALEIIKDKRVNVADLVDCIINEKTGYDENGLEEYNGWQIRYRQLTQAEFDLLKEVLLCQQ